MSAFRMSLAPGAQASLGRRAGAEGSSPDDRGAFSPPTTPRAYPTLVAAPTPEKLPRATAERQPRARPRPALAGEEDHEGAARFLGGPPASTLPALAGPAMVLQPALAGTAVAAASTGSPLALHVERLQLMPSAGLQAAVRADMAAALVTDMHAGVRRPTSEDWRCCATLREHAWECPRCLVVMSKRDEAACVGCGVARAELGAQATGNAMESVVLQAHRLAYGRNLVVLQEREPVLADGGAVAIGAAGYTAWAQGQLAAFSTRPMDKLLEPKPASAVCTFDGWLCMQTNGRLRFNTRAQVRDCLATAESDRGSVEHIVADFVSELGKVVQRRGESKPVLMHPKGGWWMAMFTHLTEHDMRIARAILGGQYDASTSSADVASAVRYGSMEPAVYGRLAALAAAVFVRMACIERTPGSGRVHRVGGAAPSAEAYAANGFEVPRYLVAMLVGKAASSKVATSLFAVERCRRFMGCGTLFVVGAAADGGAYLVSFDGMGVVWVPAPRLEANDAGAEAVARWSELKLSLFKGYSASASVSSEMVVPHLLTETHTCTRCLQVLPVCAFTAAFPNTCQICTDVARMAPKQPEFVKPRKLPEAPEISPEDEAAVDALNPLGTGTGPVDESLLAALDRRLSRGGANRTTTRAELQEAAGRSHRLRDLDYLRRAVLIVRGERRAAFDRSNVGMAPLSGGTSMVVRRKATEIRALLLRESELFSELVDAGKLAALASLDTEPRNRPLGEATRGRKRPRAQVEAAPAAPHRAAPACAKGQAKSLPVVPAWPLGAAQSGLPMAEAWPMPLGAGAQPALAAKSLPVVPAWPLGAAQSGLPMAEAWPMPLGVGAQPALAAAGADVEGPGLRAGGSGSEWVALEDVVAGRLAASVSGAAALAAVGPIGPGVNSGGSEVDTDGSARSTSEDSSAVEDEDEDEEDEMARPASGEEAEAGMLTELAQRGEAGCKRPLGEATGGRKCARVDAVGSPSAASEAVEADEVRMLLEATLLEGAVYNGRALRDAVPPLPAPLRSTSEVEEPYDSSAAEEEEAEVVESSAGEEAQAEGGEEVGASSAGEEELTQEAAIVDGPPPVDDSGEAVRPSWPVLLVEAEPGEGARGRAVDAALAEASNGGNGRASPVSRKHKEAVLLRQYRRAMCRMAFKQTVSARQRDADGVECNRTSGQLKFSLQELAAHIMAHMGAGFDVRKLGFVVEARKRVGRVLLPNNQNRAISIHDGRMYEGYLCFDTAYAPDSFLAAQTGAGEVHGLRASCVFLHLRKHWSKSDGAGLGWTFHRLGKSNQKLEVRKRDQPHARCCPRRLGDADPLAALTSHVQVDPVLGPLPETRCGMCAVERLWVLADGGAPSGASVEHAFLPAPKGAYRKFSWEKGARPMPTCEDGSLDLPRIASECFHWYAPSPATLNRMYDKWVKQINRLRRSVDAAAPLLPEELWRPHGCRHGAVYNTKRAKVPSEVAAPFLCMSDDIYRRVYGLEEMDGAGQEIVPDLVGHARTQGAPA